MTAEQTGSPGRDELRRMAQQARVARLATVDRNGRPHVVPITFALEDDVLYSAVDAKPKSTRHLKRLRNIEHVPDVTVLVDHYDEDWSRLRWCRMDGRAEIVSEGQSFETGLRVLRDKYTQYRKEPPEGPVIAVEVRSWSGWAATKEET